MAARCGGAAGTARHQQGRRTQEDRRARHHAAPRAGSTDPESWAHEAPRRHQKGSRSESQGSEAAKCER